MCLLHGFLKLIIMSVSLQTHACIHFIVILVCRFLWEALVYGSEESSLPMVGLPVINLVSVRLYFLYCVHADILLTLSEGMVVCYWSFSHEYFQELLS